MVALLDAVELRVETDSWAFRTVGTIVEVTEASVLVEISDEQGRALDLVSLPPDAVKRLEVPSQKRPRS